MKSVVFCLMFLCASLASGAQQVHFVYLQSDNKQPFYVRYNDKIFSSSSTGYLVIPKLRSGEHKLSIGFPKNEWPLQTLTVQVADKDLGFALKNFENKGWGLFNLQTMEVINSGSASRTDVAKSVEERTDNFSNVLSDVVNTPSIKEQKKEPVVATPVKEKEPTPQPIAVEEKKPSGAIRKISSLNEADGLVITYQDEQSGGNIDTIQITIEADARPNETAVVQQPVEPQKPTPAEIAPTQTPASPEEDPKSDTKFLNIEVVNPNATPVKAVEVPVKSTKQPESATVNATPLMLNSDCKHLATEEDFLKIRKRMTSEKNDENMIKAASKMFKQKCYSTDQIRNLSVLFLKDEEKYRFFDAAYPFVHDSRNFKLLESQLTDPYTITRFRAMIRN